jgi:acid phosphatase
MTPAHDNLDAVLWLQTSTEYAAVTTGVYAAATAELRERVETDPAAAAGMAVVLDVDETVLDNSRYQGQLVLDDATYESETWDRWIELRAAGAVPGAIDFIRTSQSLGVHVALITNRTCRSRPGNAESCPQKADTLADLDRLGADTGAITLFLRGDTPPARCRELLTASEQPDGKWSSDKTSRRACVSLDRDIVMLFGDQLGDFTEASHSATGESGHDIAAGYEEFWGKTWFMLPNPTYGGWRPNAAAEKRKSIQGID